MAGPTWIEPGTGPVRRIRITPRSAVLFVGAVVAFGALRGAFVASQRVLGWAAAATIVAILVEPVVGVLGRRIPRVVAVLGTFAVLGAAVVGLVFGAVDDLDREVRRLQRSTPEATAALESRDDQLGEVMRDLRISERADEFLEALDERIGSGSGALAQSAPSAPVYLVSAILAVFLLVYGPGIVRGAAAQVPDPHRRAVALATVTDAVARARVTVWALLVQGLVVGVLAWSAAITIELPAPIVLGLVAGVGATLPDVGILLGSLPLIGLAAGVGTGRNAVVLLAVAFTLQATEALVVRPRVDRRGVAVGPAVVWVVALVGFHIHGPGMAIGAVVVATFVVGVLDSLPAARAEISAREALAATTGPWSGPPSGPSSVVPS